MKNELREFQMKQKRETNYKLGDEWLNSYRNCVNFENRERSVNTPNNQRQEAPSVTPS